MKENKDYSIFIIILLAIVWILLIITVTGCTKTQYVNKIVEVEKVVPIYPEVPEVNCDFYKDKPEDILNAVYECVIKQKKLLDSLRKTQ